MSASQRVALQPEASHNTFPVFWGEGRDCDMHLTELLGDRTEHRASYKRVLTHQVLLFVARGLCSISGVT